jgi:hypothetical protein
MTYLQPVCHSFRVVVNITTILLLTLLLVIPTSAQDSRTGILLYDVDFSSPFHTVGQPPTLHLPNQAAPRPGPSMRTGDPSVVATYGSLINQPCRFGSVANSDQLSFVTAALPYPDGFDDIYETYHLELNLQINDLNPDSSFWIVMDKNPTTPSGVFWVLFQAGAIMVSPSYQMVGTYTPGVPVFVEVDVNLSVNFWSVSLDEVEVHNAPLTIDELVKIRLYGPQELSMYSLAVDDIIICANGECHPDPYIISHPVSGIGCVGDVFTLSVTAEGTTPLSYLWYQGGSEMTGETSSTLTFDPVQHIHADDYFVRVANVVDTVFSNQATLTVYDPVVILTPPVPETQTVCEGALVSYGVGMTGTPPFTYQWRKDQVDIFGETSAGISFNPVILSDDGVYDVVVTNLCGPVTSDPCTLIVHTAPVFTVSPVSQELCIGDEVTFTCDADGIPEPDFQWYHDSIPIPSATDTSLTVSNLSAGHEGSYWVSASNHCETDYSGSAYLNVLPNQVWVGGDGYSTIASAISAVCYHDGEIIIRDGTYSGAGNYNLDLGTKQLNIHSESNDPRAVTIACGWNGRGFIVSGGQGSETIISGLTIMSGSAGTGNGGGIFCQGTSPVIDNCIIKSCIASSGGGMAGDSFSGSLVNCTFYDNYCDNYGGGLYLYNSSEPTPTGSCTFYGNEATRGSGICIDNSMLWPLTNTIITAGIANSTPGEAVHCRNSGVIMLQRSDVWNNTPAGSDWMDCIIAYNPIQFPAFQNISMDPLFCHELDEDFSLQIDSPCSAENSGVGQIGAWPVGCGIADDDETFEFGIEWIDDYEGYDDDRGGHGEMEANSMISYLTGITSDTWVEGFNEGSYDADPDHWSADNNDWVDDVDLVFFSGHGWQGFDWDFFKTLNGARFRNDNLLPGECIGILGNRDVEWIAFTCCEFLSRGGGYWGKSLDGGHMVLGYETNCRRVEDRAAFWMSHLISCGSSDPAKRVIWSWFKTCDQTQKAGRIARVAAETYDMCYDYIWGQGDGPQPDPVNDNTVLIFDHLFGDPITVPSTRLRETTMQYYPVIPPDVDIDDVEALATQLGISGTVENYGDGSFYIAQGTRYLEVNETVGIDYGDHALLFNGYATAPTLPTLSEAQAVADGFLDNYNLLPLDDEVTVPTVQYSDIQLEVNKTTQAVIDSFATAIQVIYSREIDGYPVTGPGSSCVTYITDNNQVSGYMQNWRELGSGVTVDIYDSTAVMGLFNAYGQRITTGGVSSHNNWELNALGLGYYEGGFGSQQDNLYPVYMAHMNLYLDTTLFTEEIILIPAAEMFLPMIADITSLVEGDVFYTGETINFTGTGLFGSEPYDYSWTSNQDGGLGSNSSFNSGALSTGEHAVRLLVEDNDAETGNDYVSILVTDNADFGDAPDPGYPTLLINGGPAHHLVPTVYLGSQIDAESDGQPDADAAGDDLADLADEDGIVFNAALAPGLITPIEVTTSAYGYLNGWLDFNSDSDWEDEGEQVFVDVELDSGQTTLNIQVPGDAIMEETFARFRFSTRSGLSFTGTAPDGEVEDYRVAVVCELDSLEGCLPENEPCGQRLNNGCNLDPPVFIPISCGDLYCGQTWADTLWRDSDWFEMQVGEPTRLRIFFEGEFETFVGVIDQTVPGVQGCANLGDDAQIYMIVDSCEVGYLEADLPVAGHYYLVVLPLVYEGYPCSAGPFMYHFGIECLSLQPVVSITSDGSSSYLTWDDIDGADYYKVYSAGDPYAVFPDDWTLETPVPPGVEGTSWSESIATSVKFYRVVAVAEFSAGERFGSGRIPDSFFDRKAEGLKRLPEVFR